MVVLYQTPRVLLSNGATHSALSVLPVILGISNGVLRLPVAKYIDRSGRGIGFRIAGIASLVGLVALFAAPCIEIAVIGRVYWGIGSACIDFILTVVLADMTSLKNRGMVLSTFDQSTSQKPLSFLSILYQSQKTQSPILLRASFNKRSITFIPSPRILLTRAPNSSDFWNLCNSCHNHHLRRASHGRTALLWNPLAKGFWYLLGNLVCLVMLAFACT